MILSNESCHSHKYILTQIHFGGVKNDFILIFIQESTCIEFEYRQSMPQAFLYCNVHQDNLFN